MSESPIELRGRGGGVVFQGTQSPGGGSTPSLHKVTVTAAEIAAAWDGINNLAVVPTTFKPDGGLVGAFAAPPTDSLPANMTATAYAASDVGLTVALVSQFPINATDLGYQTFGGISAPANSNLSADFVSALKVPVCDGTEAITLMVIGDAAPVSGSVDIYFIVLAA